MSSEGLFQRSRSLVPLGAMRDSHLETLLTEAREVTGTAGDRLFGISEENSALYYLLEGEVLLRHQSGRERILTADFHWFPVVQFQRHEFSAEALTDYRLLRFDSDRLDALLTWSQVADYLELDISYDRGFDQDAPWLNTVLASNLFYKIPPLNIFQLVGKVSLLAVKQGDVIVKQGDEGEYCYFIREGKSRVSCLDEGSQQEKEVAVIGSGRCFGEDALINKTTRNATVTMLTDGELIRLHKDEFQQLLQPGSSEDIKTLPVQETRDDAVYLDVRTQEEYDFRHIRGASHIPFSLLRLKIRMLNQKTHYVVYCNTGRRSHAAAFLLKQKGLDVSVLEEGLSSLDEQQVESMMLDEFDEFHQLASG